jgi:hypothetical protein
MKTYVITTGIIFGLLTLTHIWRAMVERQLATDPFFIGVTVLAAFLAIWAGILLRRS